MAQVPVSTRRISTQRPSGTRAAIATPTTGLRRMSRAASRTIPRTAGGNLVRGARRTWAGEPGGSGALGQQLLASGGSPGASSLPEAIGGLTSRLGCPYKPLRLTRT